MDSLSLNVSAGASLYPEFAELYGAEFVRGDLFRLFTLFEADSDMPSQLRIDLRSQRVRWSDYGFGFFTTRTVKTAIFNYLSRRRDVIHRLAWPLATNIASLSDREIQETIDSVLNEKLLADLKNRGLDASIQTELSVQSINQLRQSSYAFAIERRDAF